MSLSSDDMMRVLHPEVFIEELQLARRGRQLTVRSTGCAGVAGAIANLLRGVTLGPSWPLLEPVVAQISDSGFHRCDVELMTHVRERETGRRIELKFAGQLCWPQEPQLVIKQFADILEQLVVHEVREAVRFEGALVRDPHAGGVR